MGTYSQGLEQNPTKQSALQANLSQTSLLWQLIKYVYQG